ncbi:MAG: alpha-E domain-containing protein [Dehalococcoidia bacterium]
MLSRVAESLFWMSRYIERAENTARFIDVNARLILDMPMDTNLQWEPIIRITGDSELFASQYSSPNQENVVNFLVFDPNYPDSIISCVNKARENARTVREIISTEMWQCINEFYLFLSDAAAHNEAFASPNSFFAKIKNYSQLLAGIRESTMVHNEGWDFSKMGRFLERADKTSRILDMKYFIILPEVDYVGTAFDTLQWAALLRSASALDMYRKRYKQLSPTNITRFLFFEPDFPRSVKYCLKKCDVSMHDITGAPRGSYSTMAERQLGMLQAEIEYADVDEIMQAGLHEYIDNFQLKLNRVGEAVASSFFATQRPETLNERKRIR